MRQKPNHLFIIYLTNKESTICVILMRHIDKIYKWKTILSKKYFNIFNILIFFLKGVKNFSSQNFEQKFNL